MFDNYSNPYSKRVRFVAGLSLICGLVGGIISGNVTRDFSWSVALYFWISSIIGAIFIYGFAEIIEILARMLKQLESLDDIKRLLENQNKPQ